MPQSKNFDPFWISGAFKWDFTFLILPGLLTVLWIPWIETGTAATLAAILITGLLDSGHVYTTAFRLWIFGKGHASRSFLWVPLAVFALITTWVQLQIPGLWPFIVYATIFHNFRQFYGFVRWYETLNGRSSRLTHAFFYALILIPVLIYHFRPGIPRAMYSDDDLLHVPDWPGVRMALFRIYLLVWAGWLAHEFRLARQRGVEWNRLSAFLGATGLYGICLVRGNTLFEVLYPLLAAHGIGYFFVSVISLRRSPASRNWSIGLATFLVVLIAAIFGLLEGAFEEGMLQGLVQYTLHPARWLTSLIVGLYLTPLLSHYLYDSWLWTSKHPDFKQIIRPRRGKADHAA
jgi:hypothetical protein